MAASLEQMLEPDEQVVYRTGTNRTPVSVLLILASTVWPILVAFAVYSETASWLFSTILIAVPASVLAIWLQTGAAIVTNYRLLLDRGPGATLWGQQRRFDLPFEEIAEVSGFGPVWHQAPRLRLTDGRVIELGSIMDTKPAAQALASARYAPPGIALDATGRLGDVQ